MAAPTFTATADVHLGWKLYNMPELEQDLRDVFLRVVRASIEVNAEYLVVVGDLFDTNNPTPGLVSFVRKVVNDAKPKLKIIGIAGDHDRSIGGSSWSSLADIPRVDTVPQFAGTDYVSDPAGIERYLKDKTNPELVEFIFLHGQDPRLFPFTEEKKRLDFDKIQPAKLFPRLKGIVLGDIHLVLERTFPKSPKEKVVVSYCGSPGVVKIDEVAKKPGLLHYNGTQFNRIMMPAERAFYKVDLRNADLSTLDMEIAYLVTKCRGLTGKKPVVKVDYNNDTSQFMYKFKPLEEVAFVKPTKISKLVSKGEDVEQSFSFRCDLGDKQREEAALKAVSPNTEAFNNGMELLAHLDAPKSILDEIKKKALEPS